MTSIANEVERLMKSYLREEYNNKTALNIYKQPTANPTEFFEEQETLDREVLTNKRLVRTKFSKSYKSLEKKISIKSM